ncbi:YkgJ family cysteine cluster protein [Kaarinaea lacus]
MTIRLERNNTMKDCNQCGKCCIKYGAGGLSASASEIDSWRIFRPDIYRFVRDGKIWTSPDTGKPLELCPWLRKLPGQNRYMCEIYEARPDDCKYYPTTIEEMLRDECEMLEAQDLANPKLAQKKLDNIMADSRPALK